MEPGVTLGRYRIESEIGRGGMGHVYRALDEELHRPVAIKVLPPFLSSASSFVDRFRREARTVANLRHQGIVAIYDVGVQDNLNYLVMELLEGSTLAALMDEKRPMAPPRSLALARQVAEALDYAHASGVIHRDVKPANVIVSGQGRAVLTDFGIAYAAAGERLTMSGSIVGTPIYMAPEQALGQTVDGRADLYSLAVVLFEMLSGAVPFQADSTPAILLAHAYQAPPSARLFHPALPTAVDQTLQRALAKDPADRYQTGAGLVDAVEAALSTEAPNTVSPPAATPPPPPITQPGTIVELPGLATVPRADESRGREAPGHDASPEAKRRRRIMLLIAVAAVALVIGGPRLRAWVTAERTAVVAPPTLTAERVPGTIEPARVAVTNAAPEATQAPLPSATTAVATPSAGSEPAEPERKPAVASTRDQRPPPAAAEPKPVVKAEPPAAPTTAPTAAASIPADQATATAAPAVTPTPQFGPLSPPTAASTPLSTAATASQTPDPRTQSKPILATAPAITPIVLPPPPRRETPSPAARP